MKYIKSTKEYCEKIQSYEDKANSLPSPGVGVTMATFPIGWCLHINDVMQLSETEWVYPLSSDYQDSDKLTDEEKAELKIAFDSQEEVVFPERNLI